MFCCKDSIDRLLDFLDGEMPKELAHKLEAHVSSCPPCVDFLRTYQATPGLCRKALQKKMPIEVASKLTDFLRQHLKK
ncbi:MAG TPA: zf-HC2 domain-containing protein [Myxococcaceae bacterium]|nr:zf-HC2 domain-containing protein [Myxococcaceae bacterium]